MKSVETLRRGLRLVRAGIAGVVAFLIAAGVWVAVQAARNPDVRARRPRWLDADAAYDVSYWAPLLVTVVVGALLVLAVLVRAARRLKAGEDLFGQNRSRGNGAHDAPGRSR